LLSKKNLPNLSNLSCHSCYRTLIISGKINNFFKDKNINPVYVYENLDLEENRKKLKKKIKQIRSLAGIYLILNKITLEYYICSASTNQMYNKFFKHLIYLKGGS